MKAKYIKIEAGYEDLTLFEIYHVEDIQCVKKRKGRSCDLVEKIQIKHGEVAKWYDAKFFELYAEAAAALQASAGADTAMPAMAEMINKGGVRIGLDLATGLDMTAEITAKEGVKIGEAFAAGLTAGIKEAFANADAREELERQIEEKIQNNLMFGA